jgi:CzcA family heavy metal efflux pump
MKNFFEQYRNPILLLLFFILGAGLFAYNKMQTSLFPEVTFPKIKIIADAGLQPVNRMMISVTKPLESAIKQVPDLQMVRSTTSRGTCEISAFMNWDANIDLSKQRIESKIAEIKNLLPADVQISVEKMNPSILPVMGYTLESSTKSPIELKQLANYTIKPFLSQTKGVSEIRIIGGKQKEFYILLNVNKMAELSISPENVNTALTQTNFVRSNGYLNDYRFLYLSVTDAAARSIQDIKAMVIRNDGKRIITVGDIADVQVKEAKEYVKINANGKEGILIAVLKQPNANLLEISAQIKDQIEALKHLLPKDVSIKPYYIQADFVNDSIKSVTDCLWIGLALAIIVSLLFLRSYTAGLTLLLSIPLSLSLTLLTLYLFGYTLNIMTLGAIAAALGLIIDDAIVVIEQIHRTHEEHPEINASDLVKKAIRYLFPAMLGSSLSTIIIFLPFVFMSGVAGAYFKVMTNTMIVTLTASFIVSWICLPVIYLLWSRIAKQKVKVVEQTHNQKWLAYFLRKPGISLFIVLLLIASSILIIPRLASGFLPEMDEGSIVLDYNSPPGTTLDETDRILHEVEKIIDKTPEVEAYSRRTGTQMGFFITEPNRGDYLIQLKKHRDKTTEEVISDLRKKIESTQPALRIDFGQLIGDMLGDLMTSVQPIEIKIFGDDRKKLNELAIKLANTVSEVKGTADVFNGIVIAGPTLSIQPDPNKLAQFGITAASLQYQLQNAVEGNIVGSIYEKEQSTNIRCIYPGHTTHSVTDMKQMQVFLPGGKLVPINTLVKLSLDSGDAEIQRQNLQSMGVVTARLENRDLGSVMADIQKKVASEIQLPQAYHIEYGGAYAEQKKSFTELLFILLSSCVLVFAVILFLFKDFRLAFSVLLVAILGVSGSFIALFFSHTPLNVGSYTGAIMIVGIIGENAIFTIRQFLENSKSWSVHDSIMFSISTRLRPKLMTAIGAIVALMPIAAGIGTGAQLHQPLAIAVIGGFIVALPLLLIVLPTMLQFFYNKD